MLLSRLGLVVRQGDFHFLQGDKLSRGESDRNVCGFPIGAQHFKPDDFHLADIVNRFFQFAEGAGGLIEVHGANSARYNDGHVVDGQIGPALAAELGTIVRGGI